MPVYNEASTIEQIVPIVLDADAGLDIELVIVNDGSTDGTREKIESLREEWAERNVVVVHHDRNRGKGAAVRTAIEHMTGDYAIVQDADLEYDPSDFRPLLEPLVSGKADVVFGSRFLGGPHRVHLFWHYVGNRMLTGLTNMLYNINLTDMETCYKAFRAEVLKKLKLRSNDFTIEPEITAKVCKMRCVIYEVPISYYGRSYEEGKKITWRDGFRAVWAILRYRFVN